MEIALQAAVTKAASFSGTAVTFGPAGLRALRDIRQLVVTLDITSAERDSANETYDFYITTSDGVSSWDIAHFPQVATTGAKRFTLIISLDPASPVNVTTAAPGVLAQTTGTMQTDTAGSNNGIKTLGAGIVRHGAIGKTIGYELVVAGTVVTGIAYSIQVQGRG
jgi:hypothetical protein